MRANAHAWSASSMQVLSSCNSLAQHTTLHLVSFAVKGGQPAVGCWLIIHSAVTR